MTQGGISECVCVFVCVHMHICVGLLILFCVYSCMSVVKERESRHVCVCVSVCVCVHTHACAQMCIF